MNGCFLASNLIPWNSALCQLQSFQNVLNHGRSPSLSTPFDTSIQKAKKCPAQRCDGSDCSQSNFRHNHRNTASEDLCSEFEHQVTAAWAWLNPTGANGSWRLRKALLDRSNTAPQCRRTQDIE